MFWAGQAAGLAAGAPAQPTVAHRVGIAVLPGSSHPGGSAIPSGADARAGDDAAALRVLDLFLPGHVSEYRAHDLP